MTSKKEKERVFENPPLREVIAEVHWSLTPLQAIPGGAVDPFYEALQNKLAGNLASHGYVVIENRQPAEFPIELLAHRPVRLFRKAPNAWPAYQVGPGLFTANIVPPYDGWASFVPTIRRGLQELFQAHPDPDYLKVQKVVLRYINAFTASHGMKSFPEYVQNYLGFAVSLPSGVVGSVQGGQSGIRQVGEIRLPLKSPAGAQGVISWNEAITQNEPSLLLDLSVSTEWRSHPTKINAVLATLDEAHGTIHDWFMALVAKKIRPFLGNEKEV